ncbi:MAG: aminodeoxychorismate synthase component I [Bacteroidetes bacterium]|nr:MAG: aminodeoxychorismate synthase component I [Bacteroidota bacterium]
MLHLYLFCPVQQQRFSVTTADWPLFHARLMAWIKDWPYFAVYENQRGKGWDQPFRALCAKQSLKPEGADAFSQIQNWQDHAQMPIALCLSYDLKNQVERLESTNPDRIHAPLYLAFEAEVEVVYANEQLSITAENPEQVFLAIHSILPIEARTHFFEGQVNCGMAEAEYLDKVNKVRQHIEEGDVYELNLCVEFFSDACKLDMLQAYFALRQRSAVPMSAFLKFDSLYVLSASPERFLQKQGDILVSQPIKGTRPRAKDPEQDLALREELLRSEKDRAENVMIVDLVRNDLAHSCIPGTVKVPELFGIYSFPQVHQMISEVRGQLRPEVHGIEAMKSCFPMGSMTGAPKVMAMQLIEGLENAKRGIYSGSIGVLEANGDFDLNVVIRTLVYNEKDSALSFQAGGAITYDSKPEEEWREILIKASAIHDMLAQATYPQDLPVT